MDEGIWSFYDAILNELFLVEWGHLVQQVFTTILSSMEYGCGLGVSLNVVQVFNFPTGL